MRRGLLLLAVATALSCARLSDAPVPETPDAAALVSRSAPGDLIAQCVQRIRGRLVGLGGTHPQLSTIKEAKTTPTSLVYQKGSRKQIPAPPAPTRQAERKGGPYEYSEKNACHVAFYFHYPVHSEPLTRCSDQGHYYEEAKLRLVLLQWHHGAKAWDANVAVLRIVREEADRLAANLRDLPRPEHAAEPSAIEAARGFAQRVESALPEGWRARRTWIVESGSRQGMYVQFENPGIRLEDPKGLPHASFGMYFRPKAAPTPKEGWVYHQSEQYPYQDHLGSTEGYEVYVGWMEETMREAVMSVLGMARRGQHE